MEIGLNDKIRITLDDIAEIDVFLCNDKKYQKKASEIHLYKYGKLEAILYVNNSQFATQGNVSQKEFSEYFDVVLRLVRTKILENSEIWRILERCAYVNELLKIEELQTDTFNPSTFPI